MGSNHQLEYFNRINTWYALKFKQWLMTQDPWTYLSGTCECMLMYVLCFMLVFEPFPQKTWFGCLNHQRGMTRCSWKTKECITCWSCLHLTLSYDQQACLRTLRVFNLFQPLPGQATYPPKVWHGVHLTMASWKNGDSFLLESIHFQVNHLENLGSVIITSPEALPVLAQHLAANCNAWRISGMRMVMFWTVAKEHVQNCRWPSVPGAITLKMNILCCTCFFSEG